MFVGVGMTGKVLALAFSKIREALYRLAQESQFRTRHPDAVIASGALLYGAARITAGRRLFIDRRAYLSCGSLNNGGGYIRMGDYVEIGPYAVLWGHGGITIGSDVHIGAHVSITAHEALRPQPDKADPAVPLDFEFNEVVIEDHVLICSGTTIVPGVRIGHHSMIGAGAVVVSDIPPYSLAVGCPARVVKPLTTRRCAEGEPLASAATELTLQRS